ncbi:MAG TPA: hypothetical protein VM536_18320 [Chloroflexia bacterium]|nr:hypothetical protein [Chloroflexia bacterium]
MAAPISALRPAEETPAGRTATSRGRGVGAILREVRWRRPELWLGLLLVVVLLAAGLSDQLREHGRADSYRAGRVAEAARSWDAALAGYRAAAGYRDAATRAQQARVQAAVRNGLYSEGVHAARQADWSRAIDRFAQAVAVDPTYADVAAQLADARLQATRSAPAGLIYRRPDSRDAGLYLQGPQDQPASLLPGSDGVSRVAAFARDGRHVVYDGPAAPGQRSLYLAALTPTTGHVDARPLPASLPASGSGVFCLGGFWWTGGQPESVSYYDLAQGTVSAVALPPGSTVVGQDTAGGHLLLAAPYTVDRMARARLLLTGLRGELQLQLVDSPGLIRSAELSPDGQWVLYTREQPGAMTIYGHGDDTDWYGTWWEPNRPDALTTSVFLHAVDPNKAGPAGGRLLEYLVLPDDAPGAVTAHFAPGMPASVVANRSKRGERTVTIYEASTGVQNTFWPDAPPSENLAGPFFSPRGGFLLLEEGRAADLRLQARPMAAAGTGTRRVVPVPVPADGLVLGQVTLREDYLLYLVGRPRRARGRDEYTLYSVPLRADAADAAPVSLFSAVYGAGLFAEPNITLAPSGTHLAYIRPDGALLTMPFDGGNPVALAYGVRQVWSPLP